MIINRLCMTSFQALDVDAIYFTKQNLKR
jgi:hypothetical protein